MMLELRDNPSPSWPAWEVLYDTVQAPAREYVVEPDDQDRRARTRARRRSRSRARPPARRSSSTCGWPKAAIASTSRTSSTGARRTRSSRRRSRSPRRIRRRPTTSASARSSARTTSRTSTKCRRRSGRTSTTSSGTFGVGIINDSKYGWDKPDDNTLRLTLLHTPRPNTGYTYQSSNDLGHHRFVLLDRGTRRRLAPGPDAGARDAAQSAARRVPDDGAPGRARPRVLDGDDRSSNGLPDTTGQVAIVAMKKAEDTDEVVLRLQERYGRPAHGRHACASACRCSAAARVNAAEEEVGPFAIGGGGGTAEAAEARARAAAATRPPCRHRRRRRFTISLTSYQPRALALTLQAGVGSVDVVPGVQCRAGGRGRGGGSGRWTRWRRTRRQRHRRTCAKPTPAARARRSRCRSTSTACRRTRLRADGDFDGKKHTIRRRAVARSRSTWTACRSRSDRRAGREEHPRAERADAHVPAGTFNRVYVLAAAVGGDVADVDQRSARRDEDL